jgi:predicted ATPase
VLPVKVDGIDGPRRPVVEDQLDFPLATDHADVTRICQLVQGLPLAIELAASWLRALALDDIAAEIERGIDFLKASTRDLPTRHRSIRAVFDYSWKLLTDEERAVLRKLSVCQGGFRREAAAEIAGADLPVLASLVDKSFLTITPTGRYRRHPLLIQYTQEKLAEHPEELAQTQAKHARFFLAVAEEAEAQLEGRLRLRGSSPPVKSPFAGKMWRNSHPQLSS